MLLFEWVYILWLTEGFCWASLLLLDNIKDCKFIHVSRSDNWLLWSMMTFEQPKHSFHGSSVNVTSKHTHTHTRVSKPLFMVEKKDGVESQALITPSSDLYTCEPWPHYNPETKTFLMPCSSNIHDNIKTCLVLSMQLDKSVYFLQSNDSLYLYSNRFKVICHSTIEGWQWTISSIHIYINTLCNF